MGLRRIVKDSKLLRDNVYLTGMVRHVVHYNNNVQFKKYLKQCDNLGIAHGEDMDEFRRIVSEVKSYKNGPLYMKHPESGLYGHIYALVDYAGVDKINMLSLPAVRHGPIVHERSINGRNDLIHKINFELYGECSRDIYRKEAPFAPIFTIGPMIHYARPSYQEEKLSEIKKKLGKCLLVFPSHTNEGLRYDSFKHEEYAFKIFKEYGKGFDTVLACAYWYDIERPVFKLLESNGAIIVSSGLRDDPLFLRRLKSIISLADAVVSDQIGSYLGYSLYMGKPYLMIPGISDYAKDDWEASIIKNNTDITLKFSKVFSGTEFKITQEHLDFIEPAWGLKKIKTKEEIKAIIEIADKLLKQSLGSEALYHKNTQRLKLSLANGTCREFPKLHCRLLKEALE